MTILLVCRQCENLNTEQQFRNKRKQKENIFKDLEIRNFIRKSLILKACFTRLLDEVIQSYLLLEVTYWREAGRVILNTLPIPSS